MAISIADGAPRHPKSPDLVGTATAYLETITATGALDANVYASVVNVNGTATTVIDTYTLGSGPYEGFEKWIFTGKGAATASDSLGIVKVELGGLATEAEYSERVLSLEFPNSVKVAWVNDNWYPIQVMSLGTGVQIGTATT